MPQNCTGENMFTKLCLDVSREAKIYNREKRVSSTSGAGIDKKKKKHNLKFENYVLFGGCSEDLGMG